MSFGMEGSSGLGEIKLFISKPDSNHPPDFWADRAVERILNIAETAHPDVQAQARLFHEKIKMVITQTLISAINERKARDAMLADRKDPEIAQIIREDK